MAITNRAANIGFSLLIEAEVFRQGSRKRSYPVHNQGVTTSGAETVLEGDLIGHVFKDL